MKLSSIITLLSLIILPAYSALLGIDFGQEFTKSALVAPGVPFDIILTSDTKRKDVSGLAITKVPGSGKDIQRSFGSHAISTCIRRPSSCLLHLKSLLGKSFQDTEVDNYVELHPGVLVVASTPERDTISFEIDKKAYPVEEVLAMSLDEIKSRAQNHWNEASGGSSNIISEVAITVPGFFDFKQRQAIIDAASIAGLKVVSLVDDGLAIAINYAQTREFSEEKQYHLIYDMGAGSTKATLVSFSTVNGTLQVEVEGYGFDESVGGHLFTNAIKDILETKFLSLNPKVKYSDFSSNARTQNRLWQAADKAKLVLSANTDTRVSVESIFDEIDFRTTVTREEFEEYISENFERFTKCIANALHNFDHSNLKSVILAGGSTRVPSVQKQLISFFGSEELIAKNVNADEAAVMGATFRGLSLAGMYRTRTVNVIDKPLTDFTISYGLADSNEREFITVFPADSTDIGTSKSILLEDLNNTYDDFEVSLYNEGELISKQVFKHKTYNETICPGGTEYNVTFTLNDSKLFDIEKALAICHQEEAEDSEPKSKKTYLVPKASYEGYKPLSTYSKHTLIEKLRDIKTKERQRLERDELVNTLESSLYDLRSVLDDEEVVSNGPPTLIERATTLVSEYLEWLEYDSSDASAKEISEKLEDAQILKIKIKTYVELSDTLLTLPEFVKLANKTNTLIYELQDFMLSMSEDASDIYQKYQDYQLNFEAANSKINVKIPEIKEEEIKEVVERSQAFTKVVEEYEEDEGKFRSTSKETLFQLRESVIQDINKITGIERKLKEAHRTRIGGLRDRLTRYLKKKAKEEKKASASASSASASSASETEIETETETQYSTIIDKPSSSSPTHDEL